MALCTFVLEYEGFTCIQQSYGSTLQEALENWADDPSGERSDPQNVVARDS